MIVCVNYELLFIMNFFNFGFFSIYVQYERVKEEPNKLWWKNIKMMILVGLSFGKPTPG